MPYKAFEGLIRPSRTSAKVLALVKALARAVAKPWLFLSYFEDVQRSPEKNQNEGKEDQGEVKRARRDTPVKGIQANTAQGTCKALKSLNIRAGGAGGRKLRRGEYIYIYKTTKKSVRCFSMVLRC